VTDISFSTLGVSEPLCNALASEGYTKPTPIQTSALPFLLSGRDLLGIAQTGTGKTAAFALPILQALAQSNQPAAPKACRALILAPTRELAVQIGDSFRTYGRNLGLKHTVIVGGVNQNTQIKAMARGIDILIATPGRLLDLVQQKMVRLDQVTHFVLDEADRMLDMGFIRDIRRIVPLLPKSRQSLLFSATMPADVEKLAHDLLRNPERVEVTPKTVTVDIVEQRLYYVETQAKRKLLTDLLADPAMKRVICFTRTKHHANRVSNHLDSAGIKADAIHGNKSQNARQRALEDFRTGAVRVLVATDIAARGIDVDGITHVVNFELPNEPESYVHRIGRTGRAGATGIAISFCDPTEVAYLRDIEKVTRRALTVVGEKSAGFHASKPDKPSEQARYKKKRPFRSGGRPNNGGNNNGGNRNRRAA
jgi:ATP-dependent RNA helicase RhlE